MARNIKSGLFGYNKKEVDELIAKRDDDFEALVADSKDKIKQAQSVAVNANASVDALRAENDALKAENQELKTQIERLKAELTALKENSNN